MRPLKEQGYTVSNFVFLPDLLPIYRQLKATMQAEKCTNIFYTGIFFEVSHAIDLQHPLSHRTQVLESYGYGVQVHDIGSSKIYNPKKI